MNKEALKNTIKRVLTKRTVVADMANLRPERTGLPMVVWISPKTGKEKHQTPRLKAQTQHGSKAKPGKWVSVTIEDTPRIIGKGLSTRDSKQVIAFIKKNKEGLLKVWRDEIDPISFVTDLLKKL